MTRIEFRPVKARAFYEPARGGQKKRHVLPRRAASRALGASIAACFEFAWPDQGVPGPPWPCLPRISSRRDRCRYWPPPEIRRDPFRDPSPSCPYRLYLVIRCLFVLVVFFGRLI